MRIFGWIVASIFGLAFIVTLAFGATWLGIEWRGFFGPKKAAVEREIFEQTPSYVHGMKQDLVKYRFEWLRAKEDPETRSGIESTVRMRFAQFDPKYLEDPELYSFFRQAMGK
ncbi:MAG: hypothetical protein Q8Q32_00900 [bacterium]|nr:hypothetical protein [bacterium]